MEKNRLAGKWPRVFRRVLADGINHSGAEYAPQVGVATAQGASNGGILFSDAVRLVYSREIEYKAAPNMRFYQFASRRTELGVEPGLAISMLTYNNLALGGQLEEHRSMVSQPLSASQRQLTVTEYGNAVSSSELLVQSSFDDIMARTTTLLGRDYALVLDCELRDAALSGTNCVYGSGKPSRAALDGGSVLKVATVKDAIEILATNNAPKWRGQSWICFVHPHQSRTLRDDPAWINASNYGDPSALFTGEIGRIDDVRFIETTLMSNGAAAAGDPGYDAALKMGAVGGSGDADVFRAVLFGEAYYGVAFSLPVEIRDNGVQDYGRKRDLGWYSIFGVGVLHNDYGVVIETA
jgi:N4-gp56 family major capsid protein